MVEEVKQAENVLTPDDYRRTDLRSLWERLKKDSPLIFFALLIIIYFFYLAYTTQLTPNTYYTMVYNPVTQMNESVPKQYVDEGSYVPVSPLTKTVSNVTVTQALFGILLILALVYYIITKRQDNRLITILEAREIVRKYLIYYRDVLKDARFNGTFVIDPHFYLKHKEKSGTGELVAAKYNLQVTVIYPEGHKQYFLGQVHPFSSYFIGFVERQFPMTELDKCPNCGTMSDIKTVTTEDYKILKNTFLGRGMPSDR